MLSNERMFFQGLLAILIFAFVPLAIKYTTATPLTICLYRLTMTVGVLGVMWRRNISFHQFLTKEGLKLWLIGVIFFLHWITYTYGVKLGGASMGVLGLSTYGIQLIIAGSLFLDHRISRKDVICLFLSFCGILMIIPSWNLANKATLGLGLALLSATCFAFVPVVHKKASMFNMQTRIFAQFFGAFIFFLFFIGETHWSLRGTDWAALTYLALMGTVVAHSLWARISSTISPNITGMAYYTIAPITILFSSLFLGERLTTLQLSGAVIVIASAIANILKV